MKALSSRSKVAGGGKVCVMWVILFLSGVNLTWSLSSDGEALSSGKQTAINKSPNSNHVSEKRRLHAGQSETGSFSHVRKWKKLVTKEGSGGSYRKLGASNAEQQLVQRQGGGGGGGGGWGWGWGWPSHHGGGGSYDVYTIIAVAAFAALFGALLYELMGGSSRRSLDSSMKLPPVSLGLDSEKLPEVMVKLGDWIANSSWFDDMGNSSKAITSLGNKIGVKKWFEAFKKDPVEYQCIRKMACETLASSSIAKKSLKSNIGGVFLSVFGSFIENGDQLENLVKQVVENPKMCEDLVEGGFCDENT